MISTVPNSVNTLESVQPVIKMDSKTLLSLIFLNIKYISSDGIFKWLSMFQGLE